jgi:hypothetical protein
MVANALRIMGIVKVAGLPEQQDQSGPCPP